MSLVLSTGLFRDGTCHRRARLRALSGADQAAIAETAGSMSAAERITEALSRSVLEIGSVAPPSAEDVRALTVGDRQALVLWVRLLTFGDAMSCVLSCPACHGTLDFDVSVRRMLASPSTEPAALHECEAAPYLVRFRLPTGADQEEVAGLAADDPDAAAAEVLHRCVASIKRGDGSEFDHADLPDEVLRELPAVIAELDPWAETQLAVRCPACGVRFQADLDAADYLFREIALHAADLELQVHVLASEYHWSEPQILALSPGKRRRYLELVAGARGAGA